MPPGTAYSLEVNPRIPEKLARLQDLANNLWYSWDRPTRTMFSRLHPGLWGSVGHNPKAFLKRIDQERLEQAAELAGFRYLVKKARLGPLTVLEWWAEWAKYQKRPVG